MLEVTLLNLLENHPKGLTASQIRMLAPHVFNHQQKIARAVKRLMKEGLIEVRFDWSHLRPTYRYAQRSDNPEDIQAEYGICLAEKTRAYIIGRMVLASLLWRVLMPLLEFYICSQVQIIHERKTDG